MTWSSVVGVNAPTLAQRDRLQPGAILIAMLNPRLDEEIVGIFIGADTFTGSIVANLKLPAKISSAPLMLPGKNVVNVGSLVLFAILTIVYVSLDTQDSTGADVLLAVLTILALGWHLVASIGGGDMPVVVSMLNSYFGLGRGSLGLLARQRSADRDRRPGRVLGCRVVRRAEATRIAPVDSLGN